MCQLDKLGLGETEGMTEVTTSYVILIRKVLLQHRHYLYIIREGRHIWHTCGIRCSKFPDPRLARHRKISKIAEGDRSGDNNYQVPNAGASERITPLSNHWYDIGTLAITSMRGVERRICLWKRWEWTLHGWVCCLGLWGVYGLILLRRRYGLPKQSKRAWHWWSKVGCIGGYAVVCAWQWHKGHPLLVDDRGMNSFPVYVASVQ